jgi:cell surface protein SprA
VFQTFANRDIRQFRKLSMYIHAEQSQNPANTINDKDLTAVIRMGTDFVNNYYEVRIPLSLTPLNIGATPIQILTMIHCGTRATHWISTWKY